jgi:hypothetical protein
MLQIENQLVAGTLCVLHTAIRNTLQFSEILQVIPQRFPLCEKTSGVAEKNSPPAGTLAATGGKQRLTADIYQQHKNRYLP